MLGALFNATNTRLTRARKRFHQGRGKWLRVIEATLSVALVVSFFYGAALTSSCREMPAELQAFYSLWLYPVDGYPTPYYACTRHGRTLVMMASLRATGATLGGL